MTTMNKLFDLSQLAEASYAAFDEFEDDIDGAIDALKGYSFSQVQAEEFVTNWEIVHHEPDTASGYSGTLFKYIGTDPNSGFANGELVFSQRGTKGPLDILETDIHEVATNGLAFRQIVDMYNYWQRLTAAEGDWGLAA